MYFWRLAGRAPCGSTSRSMVLFERSYLDARRSETLPLTDREPIIVRVAPDSKREEHRLDAYWLRVDLLSEVGPPGGGIRGNRVVVGRFLAPAARAPRSPSS